MKVGIGSPFGSPFATGSFLTEMAVGAEERGLESIWLGEHVVTFDEYVSRYPYSPSGKRSVLPGDGLLEPLVALSFMAASTSRLRLGTGILVLAQRNPVVTAFQLATLDWVSNGRIEVGIGLNWSAEEYAALATPWSDRGARTDEYIDVLRTLWTEELSEFSGRFYELAPCRMHPKPLQHPHPAIHVSGNSDAALRRVARRGQGWYGMGLSIEQLAERLETLDRYLAEEDRTRADVELTMLSWAGGAIPLTYEYLSACAALGLDRVVTSVAGTTVDEAKRSMDAVVTLVGPLLTD